MTGRDVPVADWVSIDDLYRDPFPIYERLRAEGGVHWVPQVNRYLVTSYDAVHETELDQETFSANEEGSLQIRAMGHSMLRRDDPEHFIERKAWQPALRPGAVKRVWRSLFERTAEHYLDAFIAKGPGADLVWDFAAPYASECLRHVIGLYNVTQEDLQRWSQTMIDATGNYADDPEVWALGERSFTEVDEALDEMLAHHAKNPDESLISSLLGTPESMMPIERIRANLKMTIGGGLNEPRDAFGVAAWALLTNPEQRAAVEGSPELWNQTFDEAIRWVAPIGMYSRQTTREVELAGVTLPKGARLGICILSANRDESVWSDADRFDLHREVKPHLAFGKGVHVCLGAWVARSEVADVALPLVFGRLEGLRLDPTQEAEMRGWVFRGMTKLPVVWDRVREAADPIEPAATPASRIAIVGSGPAGCFSAQAFRRSFPNAPIEVFDELPTPYGLVRYGVAADHQGTKTVTRQFDRLFLEEGVEFHGNVTLGSDVSLDELREHYDAVVLATGMHRDRALDIPGAALPGTLGAGAITRFLNHHPDAETPQPLGENVVVIGHGNVAMDIVRLIAHTTEGLDGSDIHDASHRALTERVRTIHVVGRSLPANAKFDPVMVRELAGLDGVEHVVHGAGDLSADRKDARIDAVRALTEARPDTAPGEPAGTDRASATDRQRPVIRIEWWFGLSPARFDGADRVELAVFSGPAAETVLPADSVITAVGFDADEGAPLEPGAHPSGRVEAGLYTAGWLRRGPRGTIPDQRADAKGLANILADDIRSGAVVVQRGGFGGRIGNDQRVSFDEWRRIDLRERLTAAPGRVREKLRTRAEQLLAARDDTLVPPAVAASTATLGVGIPTTILFGTESGGSELVADELATLFGPDADVRVHDLAETSVAALTPGRLHLIVCSTYGDGEVPTSVEPFVAALVDDRPDLNGIEYAVFGMGDRSYEKTYSRGSEIVDEALASCGAMRVGEYGRHDAGGSIEAAEAATEWAQSVFAELAARTVPAA